jgi:hypothetical protein
MNRTRTLLVTLLAGGLLVGAAATAGLLTAGGASAAGGSAAASAPSPSSSTDARPDRHAGPGRHGGPGGLGGLRRFGGGGPLLHGEFVTGGQNGTTRTVVVQNGTVSAKDGSKITVTSSDGYKVEWVLNDSTKVRTGWSQGAVKDIAKGDAVLVQGTKTGGTTTAQLVAERPKGAPNGGRGSSTPSPSGA